MQTLTTIIRRITAIIACITTAIPAECPECGVMVSQDWAYCDQCGTPLPSCTNRAEVV